MLTLKSFLLIACGAISGACLRFVALHFFSQIFKKKYWATSLLNIFSSFVLGLFFGLNNRMNISTTDSALFLLVGVGFLGSFSTFSTFLLDIFQISLKRRWNDAIFFTLISIFGALLAASGGYTLGYGK